MKASFQCAVCREKLELVGTPDRIERVRIMWLEDHSHLASTLQPADLSAFGPCGEV